MAQLLRLNEFAAIEFDKNFAKDLNERKLYVYDFPTAPNALQLLSDDLNDNSRQYSYSPYLQNVLLTSTPRPFYSEHANKELSVLLNDPSLPSIEYIQCRLHTVSGFKYTGSIFGVGLRIFVKVNGDKEITLASIFDLYNSSRMQPNNREVVLDNIIFSQSINFSIPDLYYLLNSTNSEIAPIKELILGSNVQSISQYYIEYFTIDESTVKTFVGTDGFTYSRLNIINVNTSYFSGSVVDDGLVANIEVSNNSRCLFLSVLHTKYDLAKYLEQFKIGDENFTVRHGISISYYNNSDELLASTSHEVRNLANDFLPVSYRPVIPQGIAAEYAYIELRSSIINESSGMVITRYRSLVMTDLSLFKDVSFNVELSTLKVNNVHNITKTELRAVNDAPKVLKILTPYYVFVQKTGSLQLHPYENTVSISVSSTDFSGTLYIRLEDRVYKAIEQSNTSATFTIPASEYNKKNETFFVVDSNGRVVTFGKIERIKV